MGVVLKGNHQFWWFSGRQPHMSGSYDRHAPYYDAHQFRFEHPKRSAASFCLANLLACFGTLGGQDAGLLSVETTTTPRWIPFRCPRGFSSPWICPMIFWRTSPPSGFHAIGVHACLYHTCIYIYIRIYLYIYILF